MPTDTANAQEVLGTVSRVLSQFTWEKVLILVLLILGCIIVKRVLMRICERAVFRLKIDKTLHTFIRSALNVLLWLITILIAADYVGIPVTSLLAVLSLIGLAVSLAIQGTLSNLAGGLMLLTAKPFGVGDYVETADVSGTISEIGLVYTKMSTVDNKVICIPNSEISGAKIVNYTGEKFRRVDLLFSASYDAPVEKVEAVLLGVLEDHPKTLREPAPPFARVSAFGSSAIDYTTRVWCRTEDYWQVHFDLLQEVKRAFDRNGIEMTYNHINVHMKKE